MQNEGNATPNDADDTHRTDDFSPFSRTIYEAKYAWKGADGQPVEDWPDTAERAVSNVMGALGYSPGDYEYDATLRLIAQRKFLPGGRYLYASGRDLHQTQNCLLMRADDSREGWASLMHRAGMALMTGAGIGVDYSGVRAAGMEIKKTGGQASGPIALMNIVNGIGRGVMQGGSRRSAIWAGLSWKHDDVMDFIRCKDWSQAVRDLKAEDFNFPGSMDMTNISVLLDDEFFDAYGNPDHIRHRRAHEVYWKVVSKMTTTGEPGFSVDVGGNAGETLRNACT
jgi:ribonucleoside-diphosphate reductase alpha chain